MGEPFDHCPPGWIGQSRKCGTQFIHNRMVVDYRAMSSVDVLENGKRPVCLQSILALSNLTKTSYLL
jgi:hypothetical protein